MLAGIAGRQGGKRKRYIILIKEKKKERDAGGLEPGIRALPTISSERVCPFVA